MPDDIISLSVDVKKIDKSRFIQGKKGLYMDLMLFPTPDSEYGDYMVKQKSEKGEQTPILGNAKKFRSKKTKEQPSDNGNGCDCDW